MINFIKKLLSPTPVIDKTPISTVGEVKQYYEDWTQRYIESFGDTFQSRRLNDLPKLTDYLINSAGIESGMRIVDAGCGICGPAILLCQKLDIHIDAITLSEEQAAIAKKKVTEAGLSDKINVICGDFQKMDSFLKTSVYDGVIYLESFVHSDNTQRAVDAAVAITKPGGFIYIKDLYHGTARNAQEKKDIATVVENSNRHILMNVKKLHEVVAAFENTAVTFDFIKKLGFDADVEVANEFIRRNMIPLNQNITGDIFFLKFLDYYEIRVTKLFD
jgi:2-polyprenyl-3-methyl-5-hydroxy-6-metoxy-1,4-benzoquinol methylase